MMRRWLPVAMIVAWAATGCRSAGEPELSLATPLRTPVVFQHGRRGVDAHGADFVYLIPISVGSASDHRLLLWLGEASTVSRQLSSPHAPEVGARRVRILLDDDTIELGVEPWQGDELWIDSNFPVRRRLLTDRWVAPLDAAVFARIGAAERMAVAFGSEEIGVQTYRHWSGRWQDWAISTRESEVRLEAEALRRPLLPPAIDPPSPRGQ